MKRRASFRVFIKGEAVMIMPKIKLTQGFVAVFLVISAGGVYAAPKFSIDVVSTGVGVFTHPDIGATTPYSPALKGGTKILIQGDIYAAGVVARECQDKNQQCTPTTAPIGRWWCSSAVLPNWQPGQPFIFGNMMFDFNTPTSPSYSIKLHSLPGTGVNTIVSQGYENNVFAEDTPVYRAITGGTGAFQGANGQILVNPLGIYNTNDPANGQPVLRFNFDY